MSGLESLPKVYDPQSAQRRWYPVWLERGYFHADASSPTPPYCIVIPPPNVTGALHLGHALNNTLQDILIRWRRMQGYATLWMPGTDHAGIATQAVVERRIFTEEKKSRHDLGRDELVRRIWQWKDEYEARILSQLRLMGCSCDWDRTRFTLDATCSRAVRRTFFYLFKAGKIFRGKRLVNWDTHLHTAVADDEIYYEDVQGQLWTIRYPVSGSSSAEALHVATTRPETMLGDTAVAVHPDDPRYRHLIGRTVDLPLAGRSIPIIGDAVLVDPTFGTGCVKVTPAHDPNDYQTGLRHSLPMINLLNPDGTFNENAGQAYAGLDRYAVRKKVVADLEALGLLEKVEAYATRLNYSDRSKTPIEPYLSDQWFVHMGDGGDGSPGFAQLAMDAVTTGRVRIHPERYAKSYLDWLGEKRDWCISRQLWWGHRIPIWYCDTCTEADLRHAFADRSDVAWIRAEAGGWLIGAEHDLQGHELGPGHLLTQDPDVLDTWFSSALWPHSTLGWPEATPELAKFYPTSVLSTARDIITLWVARMVIFGQFNCGDVPFVDVFIHPVIQDGDGKRMSKSAGNGIDPVDIIDTYGADALRFTLASSATETQDLRMPVEPFKNGDGQYGIRPAPGQPMVWVDLPAWKKSPKDQRVNTSDRFEQGRTFPNKIWNAARLVLMNLEGFAPAALDPGAAGPTEDRWILGRLAAAAVDATAALERFQFADSARTLRDFAWTDFCDWYLELVKGRLRSPGTRQQAQQTLVVVLDGLCRLLHPVIPFVTEEVWQALNSVAPQRWCPSSHQLGEAAESVCIAAWPRFPAAWADSEADFVIGQWQEKIAALRNLRAERNVPEKAKIHPIVVATGPAAIALEQGRSHLQALAGAESISIVPGLAERPAHTAVAVLPDAEILLPLEGLIDRDAERARQQKALAALVKQAQPLEAKLADDAFAAKAPLAVVDQFRTRLAELKTQIAQVEALLTSL
jgi:valyl-tRNA synthetase